MTLRLRVLGVTTLRRRFDQGIDAMRDLRAPFRRIIGTFHEAMEATFRRRGAPRSWAALSRDYARRKASDRPGRPIGEYSGRLRRSLTGSGREAVIDVGRQRLVLGSAVRHAHLFAAGRRRSRRGGAQPARPLLQGIDMRVRRRWVRVIGAEIDGAVSGRHSRGRRGGSSSGFRR